MKMKEAIPHGEEGHIHYPGCEGYAKGGVVSGDAKALADVAESGMPLAADPEMIQSGLDAQKKQPWTLGSLFGEKSLTPEQIKAANDAFSARTQTAKDRNPVSNLLHNAGEMAMDPKSMGLPGVLLKKLVNPTTDYVPNYAKGGVVPEETKDPSEIPEHIREFVENAHKERRESRPDENWRIKSAETPESVAPYKRDEDEMAKKPSVLDRLKGMGLPKMAEGGEVPEEMAGDPEMAQPPIPMATPNVARGTLPVAAPTDQSYMDRANKMLGLNPEQQAGFMKLLGDNAQKSQIGAGIAGIGDAIASGGTLGKVNPGALKASEEIGQNATKQGIEGMQTLRANNKENFEMGQTLRGNDPFDPEIQKSLVKQFHIPPALSGAPRDVIYKMLDPIAQTQLKEAELALNNSYRKESLDLQKQTLAATVANQKAERQNATEGRQMEAAKEYAHRGIIDKIAGVFPGTASHAEKGLLEKEMAGGAPPNTFATEAEAEAAKLPPGTMVTIGGRPARVK